MDVVEARSNPSRRLPRHGWATRSNDLTAEAGPAAPVRPGSPQDEWPGTMISGTLRTLTPYSRLARPFSVKKLPATRGTNSSPGPWSKMGSGATRESAQLTSAAIDTGPARDPAARRHGPCWLGVGDIAGIALDNAREGGIGTDGIRHRRLGERGHRRKTGPGQGTGEGKAAAEHPAAGRDHPLVT